MPALPGAHQSFVNRGDAAIFQARACSRPPEPRRRMFMRKPEKLSIPFSVARNAHLPQGGPNLVRAQVFPPEAAMISRKLATWRAKALRPAEVALTVVCGRL